MMRIKTNICIATISYIICFFNNIFYKYIPIEEIRIFSVSYLKDIVGAIAFMACCNIILEYFKMGIYKIVYICAFCLFCGLFWEFVTPMYRNTTTDINDILAYILGGILYWIISRVKIRENKVNGRTKK